MIPRFLCLTFDVLCNKTKAVSIWVFFLLWLLLFYLGQSFLISSVVPKTLFSKSLSQVSTEILKIFINLNGFLIRRLLITQQINLRSQALSLFITTYLFICLYSLRLPTYPPSRVSDCGSQESQEISRKNRKLKGQQENSGHPLPSSRQASRKSPSTCKWSNLRWYQRK